MLVLCMCFLQDPEERDFLRDSERRGDGGCKWGGGRLAAALHSPH